MRVLANFESGAFNRALPTLRVPPFYLTSASCCISTALPRKAAHLSLNQENVEARGT